MSLCALALTLAASACAGEGDSAKAVAPDWTSYEIPGAGVTVSYPPGWTRASGKLMPNLADPKELVALGTFELPPGGDNCAHMPENAVEEMSPADGLIVLEERLLDGEDGSGTFEGYPERPEHFGPGSGYPSEAVDCLDRPKAFFDRFIAFRDSDRRFYAYVALGRQVTPGIRDQAWAILDRLEIETSTPP
jgi:hypothetical protein